MSHWAGEMPRYLLYALAIVVGGYVVVVSLFYLLQSRLMYVPSRQIETTPAAHGLAYEKIAFTSADGVALSGWWVPAPESRATVLFCHGNGCNISHLIERLALLRELGLNSFVFDYRGYGDSHGTPSEKGTYLDAEAAWRVVVEDLDVEPRQVVGYGWSRGGAIAAHLAATRPPTEQPGWMVLESAFTSAPDIGSELYPLLPVRWLTQFSYNTLQYLSRTTCPVLIVHSREDELIPIAHGRRLLQEAGDRGRFLETNGNHAVGYSESTAAYRRALADFLSL